MYVKNLAQTSWLDTGFNAGRDRGMKGVSLHENKMGLKGFPVSHKVSDSLNNCTLHRQYKFIRGRSHTCPRHHQHSAASGTQTRQFYNS